MTSSATIDALTDHQAIRVLALVIDHQTPLPDPTRLRELDAALSQVADNDPDLRFYRRSDIAPPTEGDLARAALSHLAATRPELAPVVDHAVGVAEDTTRFEPATLVLGGLVLIALQTEIKVDRNTTGQWKFRLHKKAMRDSTLGQLLGKLLALYANWRGRCLPVRSRVCPPPECASSEVLASVEIPGPRSSGRLAPALGAVQIRQAHRWNGEHGPEWAGRDRVF